MRKGTKKRMLSSLGLGDAKATDQGSMLMILASFGIVMIFIATELYLRRPPFDSRFFMPGAILFLAGFAIRLVSQNNLGRHFALEVKIDKDHELVTDGIHRFIRHPMYTGFFILAIGACIALQSMFGIIATMLVLVPAGLYRTRVEEAALTTKFGKQYKDYMSKTKRYIPYII